MSSSLVTWESAYRGEDGVASEIPAFNARGLHRVYGRADHFPGRPKFSLDIWRDQTGWFLARFSSAGAGVDSEAWQISGMSADSLPADAIGDEQVPQCLRQSYEAWVLANL